MDETARMEQATKTAHTYMGEAITIIDKKFGKGFAKRNPQLISAFMVTSALDYHAESLCDTIRKAAQNIGQ